MMSVIWLTASCDAMRQHWLYRYADKKGN